MTSLLLPQTNGSKPKAPSLDWMQQSVQQFFSAVNWDDHPPEVQALKQAAAQSPDESPPLSLALSVRQFFAAVNWDGQAIATSSMSSLETAASLETTLNTLFNDEPDASASDDGFTLDDFSGLF